MEVLKMNFDRGSLWRKWDLHVHTPFSILNNQFGECTDENLKIYFRTLVLKAIENEIFAIGITDYFMIKGYKKIREFMDNDVILNEVFKEEIIKEPLFLEKVKGIVFFPNIELRLNDTLNYVNKNNQSKLEIHVLLSNDVNVEDVETALLAQLNFSYGDTKYCLSESQVKKLGEKMIYSDIGNKDTCNPLVRGYNAFAVDIDELKETLEKHFKDKYLIVGTEDDVTKYNWRDQGGGLRGRYLKTCDAIFSSNEKSIAWFSSEEAKKTIDKYLPCFWGSDAHDYEKMFNPDKEKHCWIKADLTFAGLKAAVNAIDERIFIGTMPAEYVNFIKRAQYSIKNVKVERINSRVHGPVWFKMDNPIYLNPFMVSIIGNKGSGKSALADIISFLGNSYKMEYASFLCKNRFLKPQTKYGEDFSATMNRYNDNQSMKKDSLDMKTFYDSSLPEKVQFLPQSYIEKVCNDLGDEFQQEINKVIYSYIPNEDKLGSYDLPSLIEFKTNHIRNNIGVLHEELRKINYSINTLINKKGSIYLSEVKKNLMVCREKLRIHIANKPKEIKKPDDLVTDGFSKLSFNLSSYLQTINSKIEDYKEKINILKKNYQDIVDFEADKNKMINIIDYINVNYVELRKKLSLEGSKTEVKYLTYKVNDEELEKYKTNLLAQLEEYSKIVDEPLNYSDIKFEQFNSESYDMIIGIASKYKNLFIQKYVIEKYISAINEFTSETSRQYLENKKQLELWDNEKKMLEGIIPNTIDGESVKKYEDELRYIENELPKELLELKNQRNICILKLCAENNKLKDEYQNIYSPIQNKIDTLVNTDDEKIEFNVDITYEKDLANNIIKYMNKRVSSKFQGVNEGFERVSNYIDNTDFSNETSLLNFVNSILDDVEDTKDLKSFIGDFDGFTNYLCGLDYININYTLTLGKKRLNELSPGERGVVLLVFYLALDKSNLPLIIDQPEDNLDNQSVFTRLVPCIKKAKMNRQIIVVTHNPNIAVACDSEQIIYTHMDKESMEITYETGSLENPDIRKHVVDILEGTMPAFNMRRQKYTSVD